MSVPSRADLEQAAEAIKALASAVRHLRKCQAESEPALCGHVHDVVRTAKALLPIVQALADS